MHAIAGSPSVAGLEVRLDGLNGRCDGRVVWFADASAVGVAGALGPVTLERRGGVLEFAGERREFDDLILSRGDLARNELAQLLLDRTALAAVPGRRQTGDLLEAATELLGAGDERQPIQGALVVHPVPGGGA